ncbi:hypothetical protein BC938DRAFT_473564, partial [Jimgerdemannia flammicorona]
MLPSNFKFSEYFNKKNPDQWNEVDFLSWLSNDELFAENRLLQDRWTRWHNYFHEALEAIISRCKDLISVIKLQPITPDGRSGFRTISLAVCLRDMASPDGAPSWACGQVVTDHTGWQVGLQDNLFSSMLEIWHLRMERRLGHTTKKISKEVREWWTLVAAQRKHRYFKEQEILAIAKDSLAQVEWTAARNENTRKRFCDSDNSPTPKRQAGTNGVGQQMLNSNESDSELSSSSVVVQHELDANVFLEEEAEASSDTDDEEWIDAILSDDDGVPKDQ